MNYTEQMLQVKYGDRFGICNYDYNSHINNYHQAYSFQITLRDFKNDPLRIKEPNDILMEFNLSFKTIADPVLLWEAIFEQLQKTYPIRLDGNDILKGML